MCDFACPGVLGELSYFRSVFVAPVTVRHGCGTVLYGGIRCGTLRSSSWCSATARAESTQHKRASSPTDIFPILRSGGDPMPLTTSASSPRLGTIS